VARSSTSTAGSSASTAPFSSRNGGFQGVGFAVPTEMVSSIASSLVENGKVVRGYLGVNIQNISPALADSFSLRTATARSSPKSCPAALPPKAGLKEGDVVTAVNGTNGQDRTRSA